MKTEKYRSEVDQCMPRNQSNPIKGSNEDRRVLVAETEGFAVEGSIVENHIVEKEVPTSEEHIGEAHIVEINHS